MDHVYIPDIFPGDTGRIGNKSAVEVDQMDQENAVKRRKCEIIWCPVKAHHRVRVGYGMFRFPVDTCVFHRSKVKRIFEEKEDVWNGSASYAGNGSCNTLMTSRAGSVSGAARRKRGNDV